MRTGAILKQFSRTWLLTALGPLSVVQAQPDFKQDIEQCLKAQTPKQCEAALPGCERVLAGLSQFPADPKVDAIHRRALNDTAWCENQLGRYDPAEGHYRAVLGLDQRLHGPEHPDVATSLNNLAVVLESQGKYEAAESLYRQALQMRQKLLGAEHPDVALSLNNLAGVPSLPTWMRHGLGKKITEQGEKMNE